MFPHWEVLGQLVGDSMQGSNNEIKLRPLVPGIIQANLVMLGVSQVTTIVLQEV